MNSKDYNIDLIRVAASFFVVIIHVSNYYARAYGDLTDISFSGAIIYSALTRVSVPLFFMISGALLLGNKFAPEKYYKRIIKFSAILAIWSVVYLVWNIFFMGWSYDFPKIFVDMIFNPVKNHLWYMYVLIGIYICLPFIHAMINGMNLFSKQLFIKLFLILTGFIYVIIAVAGEFGLSINMPYPIILFQGSYYVCYFIAGHIIYENIKSKRLSIGKYRILTIFLVSYVTAVLATTIFSFRAGKYVDQFLAYRNIMLILMSLCAFIIFIKINIRESFKKYIKIGASASFGVYLIHLIPFNILYMNFNITGIISFIGIPLYSIIIYSVSLGAVLLYKFSVKYLGDLIFKIKAG